MPLKITFSPDGNWTGGARLPPTLRQMDNLAVWIGNFLQEFKEVGVKYRQFMSNDGELIGQEKANLVMELDDLVGGLLLLRRYLTPANPAKFNSLENKYEFSFSVQIDSNSWSGFGKIGTQYTFALSNFADWYNNLMMKRVQELFIQYSQVMADGILTQEESRSMILFIEMIVFDILVIEKVLLESSINS
jgi:hypothetical protein